MLLPLTTSSTVDTASTDTAATDITSDDAPHGGVRDAGEELGRCRCRWRWWYMDLHIPDLQVPTINEVKSSYYYTKTSHCSISFSNLSFQTSNFAAPPVSFDLSDCTLECELLSHLLSEASGRPRAFLSYLLNYSIFANVIRFFQEISISSSS